MRRVFLGIVLFGLLGCVAVGRAHAAEPDANRQSTIALEALRRLKGVDLESNPAVARAVQRVLESTRGTPAFVEIVRDFNITDRDPELIELMLNEPGDPAGVAATRLLLDRHGVPFIEEQLRQLAGERRLALLEAIGNSGDKRVIPLLERIARSPDREIADRRQAVGSMARIRDGAERLLEWTESGTLPAELRLRAAMDLNQALWPRVRRRAGELLPLPAAQNAEPLPPLRELVAMTGDVQRGRAVFFRELSACSTCHVVRGQGVDFGPNLSEIGTKLGKDALYESILDPSSGIAFGYEAWEIITKNGDEAFGLIVSETEEEIALKTQGGGISKFRKNEIERRQKMKSSIMPAGLQQTMTTQELVDLVEYLAGLRAK